MRTAELKLREKWLLFIGGTVLLSCSIPWVHSAHKANEGESLKVYPKDETLSRVLLPLDKYPQAVCNDGSPGAYWLKSYPVKGPKTWLVFLQGGGWCWDKPSCASRNASAPQLMSSHFWPESRTAGGMFSPDPQLSPFSSATKVYIGYCSSDAFTGNAGASASTHGWHFRGAEIVQSTFKELAAKHDLKSGDSLYFSGCSAGGRGAMFNLDYVSAIVPEGVHIKGILDAAMWVEMDPIIPQISFPKQTHQVLLMANSTGRLGTKCAEHFKAHNEQWKCLYGEFRAPFVETPYLISASQYDSFQIPWNTGRQPPFTDSELAFIEKFRHKVKRAMLDLRTKSVVTFSPACYTHCIGETDSFWDKKAADASNISLSLHDVLKAWLGGSDSAHVIDNCHGFSCSCPLPEIQ